MREMEENTARLMARIQGMRPAEDDQWGRRKLEARRERSERRHPLAGEVHELRRAGHTYEEAPSPPVADAP